MNCSPIGMFDSGAGGISVLIESARMMPHEHFIFYGDDKNAPYGTKSKDEILRLSQDAVSWLIQKNVKAIVIACNTATANAALELRAKYDFPIIGMEPALKPAFQAKKDGMVLVMATPGTLKSEKYRMLYEKYGDNAVSLPCPGLMEFVERGELDTPALHQYLTRLFSPYQGKQVDAVVLGCTHYIFLRHAVLKHFPSSTQLIDGNDGTIRQLQRVLEEQNLLADNSQTGSVQIFSSGSSASLHILQNLFEENIEI